MTSRFILEPTDTCWLHFPLLGKPIYRVVESPELPSGSLVAVDHHESPPMGQPIRAQLGANYQAICTLPSRPGENAGLVVCTVWMLREPSW